MTATLQTPAPLERLNLNINARAAIGLVRELEDGHITVDLPYQRGPVWSYEQQVKLVKTWMEGLPIPAIIVNDRWRPAHGDIPEGEPVVAVIDGKQRLLTARAWFTGDLAVPASWFFADLVEDTVVTGDGLYVRYTGLARVEQRHCARSWLLPVGTAEVSTVQEEAELYLRYNLAGTPQTLEDLARAALVAAISEEVV